MTMHLQTACHRHGFATFTAVVMISLVGTTLLALTLLLQDDVRRSTRHEAEAQLRQLLIAGSAAVIQAVGAIDAELAGTLTIQPPADLEEAELGVSYERPDQTTIEATITARTGDYESAQVMRFELSEMGWDLCGTQITRHH